MAKKHARGNEPSKQEHSPKKPSFEPHFEEWYYQVHKKKLSDQQDFAKKSKAFLEWYVESFCQSGQIMVVSDNLDDFIVDGKNDKGVDLIFPVEHESGKATLIVQAKYYPKTKTENGDGARRIFTTFETLKKGSSTANQKLKEVLDQVDLGKQVIIRYISNVEPTIAAREEMTYVEQALLKLHPNVTIEWITESVLNQQFRELEGEKEAIDNEMSLLVKEAMEFEGSYTAIVNVNQIYEMYNRCKKNKLFVENIRNPLKSRLNTKIQDTLASEPENFFFYNNGVSALVDSVELVNGESDDDCMLRLRNISVINGAQTVSSIVAVKNQSLKANSAVTPHKLKKAFVQLRIIPRALRGESVDFNSKVVERNNSQNKVTPADLVSRDPIQSWLATEFGRQRHPRADATVHYLYRRGAARLGDQHIPINQFAQRVLAFLFTPIAANNSVAKLFDTSGLGDEDDSKKASERWYTIIFKAGDPDAKVLTPKDFKLRSAIWWLSQEFERRRKEEIARNEKADHLTSLGMILFASRLILDDKYTISGREKILCRVFEGKWLLNSANSKAGQLFTELFESAVLALEDDVKRQVLDIQARYERTGQPEIFSVQKWRRDKATIARLEATLPGSAIVKKSNFPPIELLVE